MTAPQATISWVKKVGNFISNILLGETKETIVRTDEKVQTIFQSIGEIKHTIENLRSSLGSHGEDIAGLKAHTKYGVSQSPTVPNDLGKQILRESGFDTVYPRIKDKLFTLMDTMGLRTLYDYEKGAVDALRRLQIDPDIDPLKSHAVSNPDHPLELIFLIASWVIRDDYNDYKLRGTRQ